MFKENMQAKSEHVVYKQQTCSVGKHPVPQMRKRSALFVARTQRISDYLGYLFSNIKRASTGCTRRMVLVTSIFITILSPTINAPPK